MRTTAAAAGAGHSHNLPRLGSLNEFASGLEVSAGLLRSLLTISVNSHQTRFEPSHL